MMGVKPNGMARQPRRGSISATPGLNLVMNVKYEPSGKNGRKELKTQVQFHPKKHYDYLKERSCQWVDSGICLGEISFYWTLIVGAL